MPFIKQSLFSIWLEQIWLALNRKLTQEQAFKIQIDFVIWWEMVPYDSGQKTIGSSTPSSSAVLLFQPCNASRVYFLRQFKAYVMFGSLTYHNFRFSRAILFWFFFSSCTLLFARGNAILVCIIALRPQKYEWMYVWLVTLIYFSWNIFLLLPSSYVVIMSLS